MIFSASRFVVVDDKLTHLQAIVQALQQLGSPCIGIQYKPDEDLNANLFRGVRALFLDLHLVEGIAKTDNRSHYGQIAAILEDKISQAGGPFILIIWTEHSHYAEELTAYLDQGLDKQKPYARPLAVIPLPKEKFINAADGIVTAPEDLQKAINEAIIFNPQLAALLGWEIDVLAAAGDTLAALMNQVPAEQRVSKEFPAALDTILSRLAREAVGPSNVDVNHRTAITSALAPILVDRIMNQSVTDETLDTWKKAVTRHDSKDLEEAPVDEAGRINRMLHLSLPGGETVRPIDWGSVVKWPYNWDDADLLSHMGLKVADMLGGQFLIEQKDRARCRPVLVRVGAACDYAQNRKGPITYLLGIEIPEDAERKKDKAGRVLKLQEAIWRSPVFVTEQAPEPFRLHVHVRFPLNALAGVCGTWNALYRIREQLLMNLIASSSNYASRPGIVQLPVK